MDIILSIVCLIVAALIYGIGLDNHTSGRGLYFIAGSIALLAAVIAIKETAKRGAKDKGKDKADKST